MQNRQRRFAAALALLALGLILLGQWTAQAAPSLAPPKPKVGKGVKAKVQRATQAPKLPPLKFDNRYQVTKVRQRLTLGPHIEVTFGKSAPSASALSKLALRLVQWGGGNSEWTTKPLSGTQMKKGIARFELPAELRAPLKAYKGKFRAGVWDPAKKAIVSGFADVVSYQAIKPRLDRLAGDAATLIRPARNGYQDLRVEVDVVGLPAGKTPRFKLRIHRPKGSESGMETYDTLAQPRSRNFGGKTVELTIAKSLLLDNESKLDELKRKGFIEVRIEETSGKRVSNTQRLYARAWNWKVPNYDQDGDGVLSPAGGGGDCDDSNPNRYPGNTEVCDADHKDEDCDPNTFGNVDRDGDGVFDAVCCNFSDGYGKCGRDCNDSVPNIHPFATEACDGIDNDCDGDVDENLIGCSR